MIRRNITSALLTALSDRPAVFVQGARQTGKSTLVQSITEKIHPARYFTMDDAETLSAATRDPPGFLDGVEGPVVLDEVQKVPGLFPAIKRDIDRHRRPGRFLLTGSANVLTVPRVSESLAGRMELLTLWPFSQGEIEGTLERFVDALFEAKAPADPKGHPTLADSADRLLRGGYPDACAARDASRRAAWFRSYLSTILQRDIRELANIEGLTELPRLLSLLASRAGGLLNFADVSRGLAIPQSTLKRYFTLLEMTFLVQTLPAWAANVGKRLVKSPKLYLNDTGLLAHLRGLDGEKLKGDLPSFGHVLENFVVMELRKQISWSDTKPEMFHYRTPAGIEVDVVLEDRSGRLVGIEVKAATTLRSEDVKGLEALADVADKRFHRGIILYTGRQVVPFGKTIHAVPINALWQAH